MNPDHMHIRLSDDWDQEDPIAWAVFDGAGEYLTFYEVSDARDFALEMRASGSDAPTLVYPLYAADGIDPEEVT